ncbi:GDP-mannose 4,6-dehydratase [Rhodobacterales bacterium 52_120_T64]|nr:GDP-mannose 4,6-dehydratase [Rhodobacterales bacterium 52_120_T64]
MGDTKKKALICGVGGQDGALLAKLLLDKGYEVWGTSRDAGGASFVNLIRVGILERVHTISMSPEDFRSVFMALRKCKPDEVYFLAGQTSVGLSFELPAETIQSITVGTLNILEACRTAEKPFKLFHAGSSECFGNTNGIAANEQTPFQPRSPYAVAKAAAIWLVDNYREAYGIFACSGILFNHESALRPKRFVTQKIVSAVQDIAAGNSDRLFLGNIDISRDWGWAPEYVEAMWLMLQQKTPENFVIATGETNSLENFVELAFKKAGLDWKDHVEFNDALGRPSDIQISCADPSKAAEKLGWSAKNRMQDVITEMLGANSSAKK